MKTTHLLRVMGREIPVRSSAPPQKVQEIETLVNTRLQEISAAMSSADSQLVLILTLLNMAEELLERPDKSAADLCDERLKELIRRLESV